MNFYLWLDRIRVMTVKELLQLLRDTALLLFVVYAFTLDVYMAGTGFTYDLHDAPFVLLDNDRSESSREIVRRFREPMFRMVGQANNQSEALALLDRGNAMIALDIPTDFQKSLNEGRQTEIQMQVDATNSVMGYLASSYGEQIVTGYALDIGYRRLKMSESSQSPLPLINDSFRVWFNPNQNDAWFQAVVELFTMISILSLMLPAIATVREKERGTIEQLLVSPLSPMQILVPKILSMTLVLLAGTAVSLFAIIHLAFNMPLRGSMSLFFGVTALYIFATSGIGIAAATFVRTQAQAAMLVILLVMPMLLLSGSWTPPEAMPELMRKLIIISPLYHYLQAGLGILFRDAGIGRIWHSILGLIFIGGVMFALGSWRFRRQ